MQQPLSSSPQWDLRNKGFVSPSQLRNASPTYNNRQQPSPLSPMNPINQAVPRPPPMNTPNAQPGSHTRTSSFFSSFRKDRDRSTTLGPAPTEDGSIQSNGGRLRNNSTHSSFQNERPPPQRSQTQGTPDTTSPVSPAPPAQIHPEIRSIVSLTVAHASKVYFSGPLIRKIERQPDGQKPSKDEGWVEVWAQLSGTTLSLWEKTLIDEAVKQGKEVPPSYVNMTDAFVQVLGSVTVPESATSPAQRYANVLTLNTAGSNLLLFSCNTPQELISWAAALRLSAWEKSRLEEIYTAHLLRISLSGPDLPTTLIRGRMEGWVRIRVAGQTDWKRLWMVISSAEAAANTITEPTSPPATTTKPHKNRMSNLFSRDSNASSVASAGPAKPLIAMYSSPKPKDRKRPPLLTMSGLTQAFAVYPERPELISRSTLIKLEGLLGDEETAAGMRAREGWLLLMPELEGGRNPAAEMLKWVVGIHDAFEMHGRPKAWSWDPRERTSLMFAYPVGPHKDLLFLDRELAEKLDPRDDRTSAVRSSLLNILHERMQSNEPILAAPAAPAAPAAAAPVASTSTGAGTSSFQLPPLSFDGSNSQERRHLSPITERNTASTTQTRTMSLDKQQPNPPPTSPLRLGPIAGVSEPSSSPRENITNVVFTASPSTMEEALPNVSTPREMTVSSPSRENGAPASPDAQLQPSLSNGSSSFGLTRRTSTDTSSLSNRSHKLPRQAPIDAIDENVTDSPKNTAGSVLTSPYSPSISTKRESLLSSSTYSPTHAVRPLRISEEKKTLPVTPPVDQDFSNALLYMQQLDEPQQQQQQHQQHQQQQHQQRQHQQQQRAITINEESEEEVKPASPMSQYTTPSLKSGTRRSVSGTSSAMSIPPNSSSNTSRSAAGVFRKPSGARAFNRGTATSTVSSSNGDKHLPPPASMNEPAAEKPAEDSDLDALAALSYLAVDDVSQEPAVNAAPRIVEDYPVARPAASPVANSSESQYKSSFAPSKQATERKAKAEAQQAAQYAAVHTPGRRAQGNKRSMKPATDKGAWEESSDEEEEEEEEEDEQDSDGEPEQRRNGSGNNSGVASSNASFVPPRQQQQDEYQQSHLRPPRNLPQIPGGRYNSEMTELNPPPRRMISDQYSERRYDDGPQIRSQSEFPQPGAARQTVWSQALDPGHTPGSVPDLNQNTGPFVTMETHAQTMTKAFTPHGLLSAGLQDKQDRSAKRQEELARESGASLINVPNKPPPPQTGLLGAITAHERDRKREGGVGAALTEREREKRLAEERQRRFDDHQRQQLDQMQQSGGSMYGQYPGFNPMMGMGNPMMMGMNPMMAMNPMQQMMTGQMPPMQGMNPMQGMQPMNPMMTGYGMGGYNPQHMFAAQQAAQAYQQAMVAFSVAGSQVGGGEENSNPNTPGQMNPMMTGFDPRMSMMSMMGPGMGPGMGMGMGQMGMQPGLQPQQSPPMQQAMNTGGSNFDPRFPSGSSNELVPPGRLVSRGSDQFTSSRNTSPVGRGSPLARGSGSGGDEPARNSRPTSPKS